MGSVDGRAARWDVPAYQVVATIGALALLAMSWLVGGEHPRWENLVLAGIAGGYAVALSLSEWVRRHRQAGIELLAVLVGLWSVATAAREGFDGDHALGMLMGIFVSSAVFQSYRRLLVFEGVVLSALAIALLTSGPLDDFERPALMAAGLTIGSVAIVASQARERAAAAIADLARVAARVHNGVIVTDPRGTVRWVNEGFCRLSGRDEQEALGRPVWDLLDVPPSDPAAVERLREAIRTAHDTRQVQLAHLRPDGAPRWVAVDLTPTHDANGELDGWILVETDIAEARAYSDQLQDELREAEERLRQSQKMEAIGRLAGGVAHDFNNLLAVILGYATLIRRKPGDERVAGAIAEVERAAERAATLTRQLLAFSRQQVLEPRVLQLRDVVQGAEGMLGRVIGEDIELILRMREQAHTRADPDQIAQVLLNLVLNARDAMPRGGRLTVETDDAVLDEAYARLHTDATPGRYVVLSVSDTGIGMSPEVKEHIFEPFFTTKPPGQGTGLGLPTVHGIVRQSGGHLTVYSELGHGTTFRVYLPATEAETSAAASPSHAGGDLSGTETVLLVEDDDQVRLVATEVLASHGYVVLGASGADEAFAILQRHPGHIDLLLTDVVMAGMGGPELAEKVRAARPDIRVLYTSGYTRDAIVSRGGELAQGVELLSKPFTADSLARKVREVLDA